MDETQRTEIEVFWKLHDGLSKQGPGSDASTRRALAMNQGLPATPRILDLGCGPGRQSLVLAQETGGHVTAVDLIPQFLEQVNARAAAAQLGARIRTRQASMDDLADDDEHYDLLWSEGAIYNIGFERGLRGWRRLLRPGGCIAVTEVSWLNEPTEQVRHFWERHYPAMQTRSANEQAVEAAGYRLIGGFTLPDSEWWDDYYTPIDERVAALRKQRNDEAWVAALDAADYESEIVRIGLDSFGYVFYIMQKPAS